jgi:protein-S-isoprenylcysteine O-methyltransferase Ste14
MYAAVLITMLALVIDQPTPMRWIIWLILSADLMLKLEYEETLLTRRFPEYAAYRKRTKRLIPFVY